MNITWDAEKYEDQFSFVHQYGKGVLSLVDEGKNGLAVDLGCGNGALTGELRKKGYRVIGIDASQEMIEAAKRQHPDVLFVCEQAQSFSLAQKADVIFSNAVFHWIDASMQEELAKNLYAQLQAGGVLVTEFGGSGCAERIHSTLEAIFQKKGLFYPRTFFFPTIGTYASILEKAGFRVEEAYLFDRPTKQKSEHGLLDWIRMFIQKPFEGMSTEQKEEILQETEKRLEGELKIGGDWYVDYVRIRVKARKI